MDDRGFIEEVRRARLHREADERQASVKQAALQRADAELKEIMRCVATGLLSRGEPFEEFVDYTPIQGVRRGTRVTGPREVNRGWILKEQNALSVGEGSGSSTTNPGGWMLSERAEVVPYGHLVWSMSAQRPLGTELRELLIALADRKGIGL